MTPGFGFVLDADQVRVLGCLVEKESTTPGSYPLTVNSLRNACNQTTSRDPILDLDDRRVESALLVLRDLRLARPVRESGARVTKFRHAMDEVVDLDGGELAVLSVLMLRGPQTLGEIRTRTTRQYDFDSIDAVAEVLAALAARAMVVELSRAAGQKESRWTHLVMGKPAVSALTHSSDVGSHGDDPDDDIVAIWLAGASAVVATLADPLVALWWDEPSVLEDQTVGGLAGHLARGGVWVVGDHLAADPPAPGPDFATAGEYFARIMDALDDSAHQAIRDRGAAVAESGPQQVAATAQARLDDLVQHFERADLDRIVSVYGGLGMRLCDYLATRVVEQVVHLDDLVRSVDDLEVAIPDKVVDLAIAVGTDVLSRRRGRTATIRALYRQGFADVLPVL